MAHLGYNVFHSLIDGDNGADYIYYSATVTNNRSDPTLSAKALDPQIIYQETRDTPIVADANKYSFSVIKFSVNGCGLDIPLFIPTIATGGANPTQNVNLTIYNVTLKIVVNNITGANPVTGTLQFTQPVIWEPEILDNTLAPLPATQSTQTGQDMSTAYYWCQTYTHWLNLVNKAMANCFTATGGLQAQFQALWTSAGNAGTAPTLTTQAPILTYNPTTYLFSLYADRYGFGGSDRASAGGPADENATLFFGPNLAGMFAGFDSIYQNGLYEIKVYPVLYQNITSVASPPAPSAKSYWVMQQNFNSTTTLWSPVESIVFVSNLLPLVYENVASPIRFGQGNDNSFNSDAGDFNSIITDITLPNQSASDYKQFILYTPFEYRMISFNRGKQAINQIDIRVFWRNRLDSKLYPLRMPSGSSVSIKCMFRRRGAQNYPHPTAYGQDI
jgi:hypothetical protein